MNLDLIQNSAIEKLSKLKAGALFMKMGTGKTKVAVELISSKKDLIEKVIWIAPASLINQPSYMDEIKRWAGESINCFEYFTIEGIAASETSFLKMRNLAENHEVFCVVDESITIKNIDAKRTKRLLAMWHLFDFRLILNGTPLSKGLIDMYSQIEFLHPKILNMTERQFANNYLVYIDEGYKPWRRWSRPTNELALIEIIRPYIFDCDLDIPIKKYQEDIYCYLSHDEIDAYECFKQECIAKIGDDDSNFFAISQSFQHFYTKASEKYEKIKELCSSGKWIIFVKFLDEVDRLLEIFPSACVITGEKKDPIDDFKNDKDILICTYGSGSIGLNLQFCNQMVFFSQTFNYKDKIQAIHRIYRTGQTKDVNVYDFWCNTGLENLIKTSLTKKEDCLDNIKRFIKNKGIKAL